MNVLYLAISSLPHMSQHSISLDLLREFKKRGHKVYVVSGLEKKENKETYIAEEEGFKEIAVAFRMIAKVEAEHERRYRKLLANVVEGKVFEKDEPILWQCRNCGYVHEGKTAPGKCPACAHPQAYFEPMKQNY